jgi:hypothetical protein
MTPNAITLLFKEARDAFPPLGGKPTDDDLLSIWEMLCPNDLLDKTSCPLLKAGWRCLPVWHIVWWHCTSGLYIDEAGAVVWRDPWG